MFMMETVTVRYRRIPGALMMRSGSARTDHQLNTMTHSTRISSHRQVRLERGALSEERSILPQSAKSLDFTCSD